MSDDRERRMGWARHLLHRLDAGAGELEASGGDAFVAETEEGGVEVVVTELFDDAASARPPREPVAAFWEAIAREAADAWTAEGSRPHVEAWISPGRYQQSTSSVDRAAIGRTLARVVEGGLPEPGRVTRLTPSSRREADFPLLLDSLTVARLDTYSRSRWHLAGAGGPDEVGPDAVEAAIGRSAGRGDGGADGARWLLLVVDDYRLPAPVPVSEDVLDADLDAPFGRVYLLRPLDDGLDRLA